jgi:hypothetical protein
MDAAAGFEQSFLLRADAHHDNAHSDHGLQRRHLEQAKAAGAGIIDFGDLCCAMQGKWDKRADATALRPELQGKNYLDDLVTYNAGFLRPYAANIVQISPGNHETAIQKHHQTDLTQRIAQELKVRFGTYAGWIGFRFTINQTKQKTLWLYYNHGYGGGGAVTKGVIQSNRMAVYLPDATFVVSSHTHDHWFLPLARTRISQGGVPFSDEQYHVKLGTYKDEFSPMEGFHIEKGREPKPMGAVWLTFKTQPGDSREGNVSFDLTRAK